MATIQKTSLTEIAILRTAADRRSGNVLPLPDDRDHAAPKAARMLSQMVTRGLIEEHRTTAQRHIWRVDEAGKHYALRVTEAGREAVGAAAAADAATVTVSAAGEDGGAPESVPAAAPKGKLGKILLAVQNGEGATLADLAELTGWQAHTIRASLTRLRQTGLTIALTESQGQKRYRVSAQQPAGAS